METLAVSPREAFAAIGVGKTKGWELVAQGDLKSFKLGGATRITTESVRELVARQLEQREAA